jgi:hypothetical protein
MPEPIAMELDTYILPPQSISTEQFHQQCQHYTLQIAEAKPVYCFNVCTNHDGTW